jgi:hypothetical protein
MPANLFFLDQDSSAHWYLVRADKRKEWEEWLNLDDEDEGSWDLPEFAIPINTHPNKIEFIYEMGE